jgi:exonuclease VII large subunit
MMKKLTTTLALGLLLIGTAVVSCKTTTEEDSIVISEDRVGDTIVVSKSTTITNLEWQEFKDETNEAIAKNEQKISEMKLKMKESGKEFDANYQQKINQLEERNKEMKTKVANYKSDASANWESFKREVNHDMTELGDAFKNLTVNNTK